MIIYWAQADNVQAEAFGNARDAVNYAADRQWTPWTFFFEEYPEGDEAPDYRSASFQAIRSEYD